MKKIISLIIIMGFVCLLLGANYLIIRTRYVSREHIENALSAALKRNCSVKSASFDAGYGLVLTQLEIDSVMSAKKVRITSAHKSMTDFAPENIFIYEPVINLPGTGSGKSGLENMLSESLTGLNFLKTPPLLEISDGIITRSNGKTDKPLTVMRNISLRLVPFDRNKYIAEGTATLDNGLKCRIKSEIDLEKVRADVVLSLDGLVLENLQTSQVPARFAGLWPECKPAGIVDVNLYLSLPAEKNKCLKYDIKFNEIHVNVYTDIKLSSGIISATDSGDGRNNKCAGRIEISGIEAANKKFSNVRGFYEISGGNTITVTDIAGGFYNGSVNGILNIHADKSEYDMKLKFSDVSVKDYAQDTGLPDKNISGTASAEIVFAGNFSERKSMSCSGTVNMNTGHLWEMPMFMEILGIFKIGDQASFDSGTAKFKVENEIIYIEKFALQSANIGITGGGRISFEGNLDLLINIKFAQNFLPQMSLGIVFEIWGAMEKSLYAFEVTGTFKKPTLSIKPFPMIDDDK